MSRDTPRTSKIGPKCWLPAPSTQEFTFGARIFARGPEAAEAAFGDEIPGRVSFLVERCGHDRRGRHKTAEGFGLIGPEPHSPPKQSRTETKCARGCRAAANYLAIPWGRAV